MRARRKRESRRRYERRKIRLPRQSKLILSNRAITRFIATRRLIGKEEEGAILLDRSAERESCLRPCIRRLISRREWVGRLDIAVAQLSVGAAV